MSKDIALKALAHMPPDLAKKALKKDTWNLDGGYMSTDGLG